MVVNQQLFKKESQVGEFVVLDRENVGQDSVCCEGEDQGGLPVPSLGQSVCSQGQRTNFPALGNFPRAGKLGFTQTETLCRNSPVLTMIFSDLEINP